MVRAVSSEARSKNDQANPKQNSAIADWTEQESSLNKNHYIEDLIDKVRANDQLAWIDLSATLMESLVKCGQMAGLSFEDAKENANDTLLRIWKHSRSLDAKKGSVVAWIFTVCRHSAFDILRKKMRRERIAPNVSLAADVVDAVAVAPGPEQWTGRDDIRDDIRQAIREAFRSISPSDRGCVLADFGILVDGADQRHWSPAVRRFVARFAAVYRSGGPSGEQRG